MNVIPSSAETKSASSVWGCGGVYQDVWHELNSGKMFTNQMRDKPLKLCSEWQGLNINDFVGRRERSRMCTSSDKQCVHIYIREAFLFLFLCRKHDAACESAFEHIVRLEVYLLVQGNLLKRYIHVVYIYR